MDIERGYKFRCYPNEAQQIQLAQTFGSCRVVYNRFLQIRTDGWYKEQRRISYTMTAAMLKALKADPELVWLNEVSSVCLQQSLRHLDKAFVNFFKYGMDYPTFKKRHFEQSAKYAKNAFVFERDQRQLTLAKQDKPLTIRWHRTLPSTAEITSIVVSKDRSDRYFISFQVKETI
jgi:putative transposase